MLTRAWVESRDESAPMTTADPSEGSGGPTAQVVDLQDWRIRRLGRGREATRAQYQYVPRHRAEAKPGNGG